MTDDRDLHFLDDFPPHTLDQWRAQAERDLKGRSLDDLTWTTDDGIRISPVELASTGHAPEASRAPKPWRSCRSIAVYDAQDADAALESASAFDVMRLELRPDLQETNWSEWIAGASLDRVILSTSDCQPSVVLALRDIDANDDVAFSTLNFAGGRGATPVQELALVICLAMKEIRASELDPRYIARTVLPLSVSPRLIEDSAKLRAADVLWERSLELLKVDGKRARVLAQATSWGLSRYDAHTNILRTTIGAVAAVAAGCEFIELPPFDVHHGELESSGGRLVLNQLRLLADESRLATVADPLAGSHAVEAMTRSLVEAAWSLIKDVEAGGGIDDGSFSWLAENERIVWAGRSHDLIPVQEAANRNRWRILDRRRTLVGINRFVDPAHDESVPRELHPFATPPEVGKSTYESPGLGAEYERLRDRVRDHVLQGGVRPSLMRILVGAAGTRVARADLAGDFFRCAGFDVDEPRVFDDAGSAVEAITQREPSMVAVCADDETYLTVVPELAAGLQAVEGAPAIVVFGSEEYDEQLEWDFCEFIEEGAYVAPRLGAMLDQLGVIPLGEADE